MSRRIRNKGDKLRYSIVPEKAVPGRYTLSVWKGKTIYRVEQGTKARMEQLKDAWKSQQNRTVRSNMPDKRTIRGVVRRIKNAKVLGVGRLANGQWGIVALKRRKA